MKGFRFVLIYALLSALFGCSKDQASTPAPATTPAPGLMGIGLPASKPCLPLTPDAALAPEVPECSTRSLCSNRVFVLKPAFAISSDSRRLVALTDASGEEITSFGDQRATLVRLDDLSIEATAKDKTFTMQQGDLALDESGRFVLTSLMGTQSDPFSEFEYEFGRGGRKITQAEAILFRLQNRGTPVKNGTARFRITFDEKLGRNVGMLLNVASGEESVVDAFEGLSNVPLRNFALADDDETFFFTQGTEQDSNAESYREFLYRLPLATGKAVKILALDRGKSTVSMIAPIPRSNGAKIAVMHWNSFSVFDLGTGKVIYESTNWSSSIRALSDGRRILRYNGGDSNGFPYSMRELDFNTGEMTNPEKDGRKPLIYSTRINAMVELLSENTAVVRDTETGADLCKFGVGSYQGAFIPTWSGRNLTRDGRTLAYTTEDGRVVMVRLETPAGK